MKDTEKSKDIMYARLSKVHSISFGWETDYHLSSEDYHFFSTIWELCDTMKEWDTLVEKYKKIRM